MKRVITLSRAQRDILAGKRFYSRRSVQVAFDFVLQTTTDIARLRTTGGVHTRRDGYYHVKVRRFPFILFYVVDGSTVIVVAVIDGRRDPDWIAQRLSSP